MLAASSHAQVIDRSLPTVWHKIGAALDVVEPCIQDDYLSQVIFGAADPQFNGGTGRLPVDLRVAVLDYWEHRTQLLKLATPEAHMPYIVAKPRVGNAH